MCSRPVQSSQKDRGQVLCLWWNGRNLEGGIDSRLWAYHGGANPANYIFTLCPFLKRRPSSLQVAVKVIKGLDDPIKSKVEPYPHQLRLRVIKLHAETRPRNSCMARGARSPEYHAITGNYF